MTESNLRFLVSKLEEALESNAASDIVSEKYKLLNSLKQELKQHTDSLRQKIQVSQKQQLLETFVRYTPAAVAMLDIRMCYLIVSDRWIEYFQIKDKIIGCHHYDVFPETPEYWRKNYQDCLTGKIQFIETEEDNFVRLGSNVDWLRWEIIPWHDETGKISGLLMFSEINTEKNLLQKKVESCEAQMRSMFSAMDELVFTVDINSNAILFLPTKFFEINSDIIINQIVEQTHTQLFHSDETKDYQNLIHNILETNEAIEFEYSLQLDGVSIWYSAKVSCISETSVIWVARDITNRKEVEQNNTFAQQELAQVTLQSISDGVITTDAVGHIQYINPVAERLTGWQAAAAKGRLVKEVFQIVEESTRKAIDNPIIRVSHKNRVCKLTAKNLLISRNGSEYAIEGSASPIKNRQGELFGVVLVFRDVTQARKIAQKVSWQAIHDPLTKLYNRHKFEQQLDLTIKKTRHNESHHALCYLDLDRFKVVNDTCGHAAGDRLLKQITKSIKNRIRASDILARMGGDEFAILLYECEIEAAQTIALQIRQLVQEFRFVWEDRVFKIGVSIGLVAIDSSTEDIHSIVSYADSACYAAKELGGNCVHLYDERDLIVAQQRGERQWIQKLNRALEENRFCLYAQKIVSIEDNNTVNQIEEPAHYEVLLRLVGKSGQLISPGSFLPAAERYNLMPAIDRWVITSFLTSYETYYQSQAKQNSKSLENIYTINLSGASINNREFSDFLQGQFHNYSIPPETICFEITETVAISNLDNAVALINQLKQLGCSIALDDFGSGMSPLNYLKNLPVDYLKIDGSFIKNIVSDQIDYATVECFNHISQIMNIKTIAEFVEDNDILQNLKHIGINYAQGYGIEVPKPLTWI